MTALLSKPPESICILRHSGLGDACHVLPVLRTLQTAWPSTRFTWIAGHAEAQLLGGIQNVEFVVLDKGAGLAALRECKHRMRGRRFDALLHMQPALQANALAMLISARVKLGFDRPRARDMQWLFTTHRIEHGERQHAMDMLFGFAERLDVRDRLLRWDIPIPDAARDAAQRLIPDGGLTLAIHPWANRRVRAWRAEYYAQAAEFAANAYGMRIVLCGGHSPMERRIGEQIAAHMRQPCINAIGQSSIEQLALIERATLLLAPDADAAHLATAVGKPVLGLYAATNSLHDGPYLSRQLCVDKYDAAARALLGKPASQIPWGTAIDREGVMDLITPDDVIKKLQSFMTQRARRR
jgi:heptosyltransferase I